MFQGITAIVILALILFIFLLYDKWKKQAIYKRGKKRRRTILVFLEECMTHLKIIYKQLKERSSLMDGKNLATPIMVTLLLILFIVICNPIAIVGVGERGVKVTLGQVSPQSYTEGIHLITPFISKIKNMDVKTQKTYIETDLYTKDIQQAKISYVINYNLQPQNAHKMYREVGTNYVDYK